MSRVTGSAMLPDVWPDLIAEIHARARPAVLAVTGGGSSAIAELLAVPGASRTVLDARVPYSAEALIEWLGHKPDHFCDEHTALAMASVGCYRARKLIAAAKSPVTTDSLGVSCTASLASDRPKRGDHRCHVAVQSAQFTASYSLILEKGARSRAGEETLVGQLILLALADACAITKVPQLDLRPTEVVQHAKQVADPALAAVWGGAADCLWSLPDGSFADSPAQTPRGVLCGAFNPLHHGHEELRLLAERRLGGLVAYEMSVTNVDKPPLDYLTIERRRQQFSRVPLALTNAPRFWQKSQVFPNTTFVVGSDTAQRIVDAKYYGGDSDALQAALDKIRQAGCRFLVASRLVGGQTLTLANLQVPATARDLFEEIPESEFRVDISSTELRKAASSE